MMEKAKLTRLTVLFWRYKRKRLWCWYLISQFMNDTKESAESINDIPIFFFILSVFPTRGPLVDTFFFPFSSIHNNIFYPGTDFHHVGIYCSPPSWLISWSFFFCRTILYSDNDLEWQWNTYRAQHYTDDDDGFSYCIISLRILLLGDFAHS